MKQENKVLDVVIIGGGVGGICQIKHLIDNDFDAVVLEANDGLGGTWYKNRYPGCRFDSESYTYGYKFSREVLDEWHWKECFSPQPETLKYLNFVVEKFGLQDYCELNARVRTMEWSEEDRTWTVSLDDGRQFVSRFLVTCMGILSRPVVPPFAGKDDFKGTSFHTYNWPDEGIDLKGKKVGVIGTGSTGIQIVQTIAEEVGELHVLQKEANWVKPLCNYEISKEKMADIRARYDEIFHNCAQTSGGFEHQPDMRGYHNVSEEERLALWDDLYYNTPGFAFLTSNFPETFMEEEANKALSEYVADRIRDRVNDPKTADILIPKDHGFGMKRVALETKYLEAYNRPNVHLVDVNESAIEKITETGIQLSDKHIDLDVIIYATGFDAFLGAWSKIDVKGTHEQHLADKWKEETKTYLGIAVNGFPNMFMVAGPQSASGATNYPRAIEAVVEWVTDALLHARENHISRVEAKLESEQEWTTQVEDIQKAMPFSKIKSWFTGHNPNLDNRQVRYNAYWGGGVNYRAALEDATEGNYKGFDSQ